MGSTGLGNGFALPHARIERLDGLFGMFTRLNRPIHFDSIDGKPVDIIFLLLIPAAAQGEHLAALAAVSRHLRDKEFAAKLRGASSASALCSYCKDANRRGDFPSISFDFLGFQFRARTTIWNGKAAHGFMPAASPKALSAISRTIRRWSLHHRSDKSLQELAEMYNPCNRGWISYYSHFYKTRLRPTLKRIDAYVIRWARRKFKRMRHQTKGARDWLDRLHRANPQLFAHWPLCHGNGQTSGAV
ncbi:MAG: PTS sugar transporter subunit IIA [Methylocella sp.]